MAEILKSDAEKRALRDCLGAFATGVTVVTTLDELGKPRGLVVNSFSSVSLEPPLVLWSIDLKSPSLTAFQHHGAFAVNIMGKDDKDLALNFVLPSEDKFRDVDWEPGHKGVPLLRRAAATLECQTVQRVPAGDHEICIGRVEAFRHCNCAPLLFHRGKFATIGVHV